MNCGDKIKASCAKKQYTTCLYEEQDLPTWSNMHGEECVTQQEINEELYNNVSALNAGNDFSNLASDCFKIKTNNTNVITPLSFAETLLEKVESLICPDENERPNDINISTWNLDFDCLVAACDAPITKLSHAFQLLVTQACANVGGSGGCCSLEASRIIGGVLTQDITIHSLTVGRGTASIVSNSAFGTNVLLSITNGTHNTGSGYKALEAITVGDFNTATGSGALKKLVSGNSNTAIGVDVLGLTTTGSGNTGVAHNALFTNTIGENNSGFGYQSLYYNLSGNLNVGVGANALYLSSTGSHNTGLGANALEDLATGGTNTAVGYKSGDGITTGSGNSILGANVVGAANLTNNIILAIGTGAIKAQYKGDATVPTWNLGTLPTYADNLAATAAGLSVGDIYKKSDGTLMIKY